MKKALILFLPCLLIFSSCEKKNNLERSIEGRMYNAVTGEPIIGGFVNLSAHIYKNGIYNQNVSSLGSTRTGLNGKYTLTFERQNTDEYIIDANDSKVFDFGYSISSDDMYSGNPYTFDIPVYEVSTVQVHLKNGADVPADNDRITYGYKGPQLPCICCSNQPVEMRGKTVDTTFSCETYADQYFVYNYFVYREAVPVKYVKDSILCKPGKTQNIEIVY